MLVAEDPIYFPISLNFKTYEDCSPSDFYENRTEDIREAVENLFQMSSEAPPMVLTQFLEDTQITSHRLFAEERQVVGTSYDEDVDSGS